MNEKYVIDYPELTMYQTVERTAGKYPDDIAVEFYGKKIPYKKLIRRIERA